MLIHLHPLNASRWKANLLGFLGGGVVFWFGVFFSVRRQLSESADSCLVENLCGDPIH